ncbi:hypothetical protein CMQ_8053 [Grosmannia clavigera kw1407]|uniref:Uncharacterized protein n=1 Tax=Grosmannia clavigera (strain kw1407 / UAMH 11150) TaxID=655863 RepID=F0XKY0_GROCL|nr:uncharacterized protein CMQ_8053 [Grosmannia clavigera kw1407]EFX01587.1 hypothetical protein CMQ_8053 [Grosmannia clavigera kw1407]
MELRNEIALKVPYDDYAKLHEMAHSQHAELETVRAELKSKYTELVDVRRRWKQLARELEKAKRQSHNVYQITDQELVQRFERLRYNISNFSMRYFGIGTMTTYRTQYFKKYLTTVIPDGHKIYHYLDSKVYRPILLQSFLWRVISGEVLDFALWAGGENGSLQNLLDLLWPDKPKTDPSYSQVERNYHHWRAMTTGLIMEAPECAAGKNDCTEYYKHVISKNIYETIRIVPDADEPRIDWAEYQQDLLEILDEAIVFDRDIYRQASHVRWLFQLPANAVFDSATMRLLKGEEPTEGHGQVEILIAPGLLKTGRSTGEDYDIENLLVPQEVSCKPAFVPRR